MGNLRLFDDFGLRYEIENSSDDLLDDPFVNFEPEEDDLNISEETDETTLLD